MNDIADQATGLLLAEALALDERRWGDWLACFDARCEYWVPAWKSEDEQTSDPMRELSLIYYADRSGLEDRVWRVESRRSVASVVLPRTQHNISNVRVVKTPAGDSLETFCNWTVHQYIPKERVVETFFGRYQYTLQPREGSLKIVRKKVILLNDNLPGKIDFYSF